MASRTFPLVRGRKMRVTRLDGCGRPQYGDCNQVVTEGFISAGLTANINEPEEITVTNANGQTCVRDAGCAEFTGYGIELSFCEVDPDLFAMLSGQDTVLDQNGQIVGFRMNKDRKACDAGVAIELWAGVPGEQCDAQSLADSEGNFGYILLPFVQGGVLGDFTIENAAITFSVTGAATKGGSTWGMGPYNVVLNTSNQPGPLLKPIDSGDHLHVQYTQVTPPDNTDGCFPVMDPTHTAVTDFTPTEVGLKATVSPSPSSPDATQEPFLVMWGDGAHSYVKTVDPIEHTYAAAGTYKVSVTRGGATISKDVTVTST